MKPGRIAGKGGMRQKTAENSTGKRNNVENFIEIVVFAVLVGIASAVTLWLFYRQCVESMLGTGLYHSDMKAYILEMQGLAHLKNEIASSLPYGLQRRLEIARALATSPSLLLQAGGSDPSGHRQSAHRNGTGHGAGNDVAEQRSDDRPENNAGQARGGGVA